MSVTTLTLSDFLLARIAEDEAAAQAAGEEPWQAICGNVHLTGENANAAVAVGPYGCDLGAAAIHIVRHQPARVLAECEAKRRIVHRFQMFSGMTELTKMEIRHNELLDVLHWLALPYADHPDYDEEWRP